MPFCAMAYFIAGIGITMGYHRLWSHRSFDAHWSVEFLLLISGSSAFQGSVISWSSEHRRHHRYTDTDKDPYNIMKGFFYAHMGWLFFSRQTVEEDSSFVKKDLLKSKMLLLQHKYFLQISLLTGYLIPMFICGYFWGDWLGGFLIAGVLSKVIVSHCTFFINSLAHFSGTATFSDSRTPRDSHIVSYFTLGEGYHNFHHEFPFDYRNGLHFYDFDPGKWLINVCYFFGLAYNLKKFDNELFEKGKLQMEEKRLKEKMNKHNWGIPFNELKTINKSTFLEKCKNDEKLMIINDRVVDVDKFIDKHPGGETFIMPFIGKDASKEFNGSIYNHSSCARNILCDLSKYRIIE